MRKRLLLAAVVVFAVLLVGARSEATSIADLIATDASTTVGENNLNDTGILSGASASTSSGASGISGGISATSLRGVDVTGLTTANGLGNQATGLANAANAPPGQDIVPSQGSPDISALAQSMNGGRGHGTISFINQAVSQTATAVPEPASLLLFGSGLAGLGAVRWWRGSRRSEA